MRREPPLTGDARLDALAGAVAEYLARQYALPTIPAWAFEPVRYLERAWHTTPFDSDGMREYLTFASPAEFRSRNIFTEERPLRRARSRSQSNCMIIAIDGPAASGKGTLGKRLAAHYGLRHLDTGLIYRAVAKALLDGGHSPGNRARAVAAAEALDPTRFDESALKSQAVGEAASLVSAIPEVRGALLAFQRSFGRTAAGRGARRPRHRNGHFPGRRREDLRHRGAAGACRAGAPPSCGRPAARRMKPRCSPTSCAGTSATAGARPLR